MKKILKNIIFLGITLLVFGIVILFGLEMYLRIFTNPPMTPGHLCTNSQRRYALKPFFRGKTYSAEFRINSLGLRGYERPISSSAYRIAVFGDSITFGVGVDITKVFPELIQNKLNMYYSGKPEIQVLNFGVPSYNTVQEYRYMAESYSNFKPHMVIVQFSTQNDTIMLTDLNSNVNRYRVVRYIKDVLRNLYSYRFLVSRFYGLRFSQLSRNYTTPYKARSSIDSFYHQDNYPGWIEARGAFFNIKRFCTNHDITLIFIIFANNFKVSPVPEEDLMYPIIKKVIATLKKAGIEHTIVIDDAFREYAGKERLLWVTPTDSHFSELAHELTADKISEYIYKHNLIIKK